MVTYNGNEMMLQNDMGNTLILDSATGNIMGLNPGFIPIGLKEHGGIMYIASVDKDGNGEIGTIPSPIIRDIYKDKVTFNVDKLIPINSGDPIRISNKLYPADKFITNLLLTIDRSDIKGQVFRKDSGLSSDWEDNNADPSDIVIARNVITGSDNINPIYTPLISYNWGYAYKPGEMSISIQNLGVKKTVNLFSTKGVYNLRLFTQHDNIGETEAPESLLTRLCYSINNETKLSNYWYLHDRYPQSVFPKDLFEATLNKDLKQFPSSNKPGYMAVKLETEGITGFNMLPRKDAPYDTPITLKTFNDKNLGEYCVLFPGFYYSTESGIYIDKLKNIRLIDESTSDTVDIKAPDGDSGGTVDIHFSQHNIQNITIDEEGLLGQPTYEPYRSAQYTIGEFPQIQSEEDDLTFLLTTVPNVFKHTATEFLSATVSNNLLIPSTTTGLMYSDIGSKYNNWYRLELDYYDQYDNKLGTFTKRFNPYFNDVFGTNLTADGWTGGDKLIIGSGATINEAYTTGHQLCIKYLFNEIFASKGTGFINSSGAKSWGKGTYTLNGEIVSGNVFTYDLANVFDLLGTHTNYIFDIRNAGLKWNVSTSSKMISGRLIPKINVVQPGIHNSWILASNSGMGDGLGVSSEIYRETINSTINFGTNNYADVCWNIHEDHVDGGTSFPLIRIDGKVKYDFPVNVIPNQINTSMDEELNSNNSKYTINFSNPGSLQVTLGQMYHGGSKLNDVQFQYINTEYSVGALLCAFEFTKQFTIHAKINDLKVDPSYSVTPYFCLTGTSEKGNPVYVQRFGKIDNIDLTYLHNFELGSDGHVYNYIPDQEATLGDNLIAPCSYNLFNDAHKFWYKKDDFTYKLRVLAGIYVLNILRCPGTAIWIMSSNNAETTADDVTLVDMNIKVNAKTYSYDKRSIPFWIATPKFTDGILNNQSAISDSKDRIYVPIVIIVKLDQDIEIGITSNNPLYHPFSRQNIGLYKIQNVAREDVRLLNLLEDVYSYNTYMKQIQQKALQLYKSDSIKYYNFILKYGVFFKEAYVFIDGLLDGKSITNIQVKNGTYTSVPYIPKDPSILPVALDSNYNFIWNAYIMPKAVLENSNLSFVFSNSTQWDFSTHPSASRSLRHESEIDSNSGNSSILPPLPPRWEWSGDKYDGIFDEITPLPVFPINP